MGAYIHYGGGVKCNVPFRTQNHPNEDNKDMFARLKEMKDSILNFF